MKQLDDFSVKISNPDHADKIPGVLISKQQLNSEHEPVSETTRQDRRRTAGASCWLAKSTRPDLSFEVSWLQQSLSEATSGTVKHANVLVKRAQQYKYEILIPGIELSRAVIVTISDTSPAKMPRQGSQGG